MDSETFLIRRIQPRGAKVRVAHLGLGGTPPAEMDQFKEVNWAFQFISHSLSDSHVVPLGFSSSYIKTRFRRPFCNDKTFTFMMKKHEAV